MNELVTIAVGSNDEINLKKAFLESGGIAVFLKGEVMNGMAPHQASPAGLGAVELQVPADQETRARELLQANA